MNPHHTPGPWIATTPPSSCHTHRFIEAVRQEEPNIILAEVGGTYSTGSIPGLARTSLLQHTANARLIAAAPDLLEACVKLVGWLRSIRAEDENLVIEHGYEDGFNLTETEAIIAAATTA